MDTQDYFAVVSWPHAQCGQGQCCICVASCDGGSNAEDYNSNLSAYVQRYRHDSLVKDLPTFRNT
jgi:hypothetical protein